MPADGTPIPTLKAVFKRVKFLGADAVQFDIETRMNPSLPDETLAPESFVDASVPRLVRASAGQASGVIWSPFLRNLAPRLPNEAQTLDLKVIP